MKDRLDAKTVILANGLKVIMLPTDDPFVVCSLSVRCGYNHGLGAFPRGSAHFLEHLVASRSPEFPEQFSFMKYLSEEGGNMTAHTHKTFTEYRFACPTTIWKVALRGFVSCFTERVFTKDEIEYEKGIILNEASRISRGKYDPWPSEFEKILSSDWMSLSKSCVEDVSGTQQDLETFDAEIAQKLFASYIQSDSYVIIGGSFDEDLVLSEFGRLKVSPEKLSKKEEKNCWADKTYRRMVCDEVKTNHYILGGFFDLPKNDDEMVLLDTTSDLLIPMLFDDLFGIFMEEFRHNRGILYSIPYSFGFSTYTRRANWRFWIAFDSESNLEMVRTQSRKLLEDVACDVIRLNKVRKRNLGRHAFHYQTLNGRLEELDRYQARYDRLFTERQLIELIEAVNIDHVAELIQRILSDMSELLIVPGKG